MDRTKLDDICKQIELEVADRSNGSFKRAIWYGNNSRVFGQNKGLRKAIRNAPRKLGVGLLGTVLPDGFGDLITEGVELALDHVKSEYQGDKVAAANRMPQNTPARERERKIIKANVKKLQSDTVAVIDRNLVKLRDAKSKAMKALADLETWKDKTLKPHEQEDQLKACHDALHASCEFKYYAKKVEGLTRGLELAAKKIHETMNTIVGAADQNLSDVRECIEKHVD